MPDQKTLEYMLTFERENDKHNTFLVAHRAYATYTDMVRTRISHHHHHKTETKSWAVY
jgi:hypothetical protein